MYWSEISIRFSRGRSTPAIRAILDSLLVTGAAGLALALLVARVRGADDPHDTLALDDLALVANLLHRRADLHDAPASRENALALSDEKPRRGFRRDWRREHVPVPPDVRSYRHRPPPTADDREARPIT